MRFRHGLVREAAYASLTKSVRARLHERHAAWLDDLGGELPEADARIAFHLESACRYQRGLTGAAAPALLRRAGDRLAAAARVARGRGDLLGEIGFLDRAVALLGTESEQGAALLPVLLWALCDAGASERAEEVAERAVAATAALGLAVAGARSAIERERIRLYRHPEYFDAARAMAVVERASSTLRRERRRARAGAGGVPAVRRHLADGRHRSAPTREAERMLGHARRAGSAFDVGTALIFMAWGLVEGPLPAPEAIARCDALAAEAADQRGADLNLRGCRAVLMAMTGRFDEARETMAEARAGLRRAAAGRDRRLPRAARRDRRDAGRQPRRGGARGPRRRGDDPRVGDPLVPGLHLRRPRARRARAGPPRRRGRGGGADRDAAGALRHRVVDQAPHRAGAAGGPAGRPRARARRRPRGGRRSAMPRA